MRIRIWVSAAFFLAVATLAAISTSTFAAKEEEEFASAPCTDSEGATTAFFCQPMSLKAKLVPACSQKKPKDLAACQLDGANSYCSARGYSRTLSYAIDAKGNLSELVCSRQSVVASAAPAGAPTAMAASDADWQPMYNVNLFGYDYAQFRVGDRNDWSQCKAACEADGQCQAWTQVPNQDTCYLKSTGDSSLLSSDACCITGLKGGASAGPQAKQKKNRTPAELKRLGERSKNAAEDEVGRRAEDKIREGIGKIF